MYTAICPSVECRLGHQLNRVILVLNHLADVLACSRRLYISGILWVLRLEAQVGHSLCDNSDKGLTKSLIDIGGVENGAICTCDGGLVITSGAKHIPTVFIPIPAKVL